MLIKRAWRIRGVYFRCRKGGCLTIAAESTDRARAELFRHVTVDKAALYRAIMKAFAAAKRQFRLHLRPDEVRIEAQWPGAPPALEEIQQALAQLVEWSNLQSQPDTARVSTLEDFYRARFLYSLTSGGEAVETGLAAFAQALARRGELQSVALEDIVGRVSALRTLADASPIDAAKVHETFSWDRCHSSCLADEPQ